MGTLSYKDYLHDVVFGETGRDFVSPANQEVMLSGSLGKRPLPLVEESSRCPMPLWRRGEILRKVSYHDMMDVNFTTPTVTTPAGVITPKGELSLQKIDRKVTILTPDRQLYHFNNQRVFSVLAQFNVLTEQQISAISGVRIDLVSDACQQLYDAGVIYYGDNWKYENITGKLWWMKVGSQEFWSYHTGMDGLSQVLSLGGMTQEDSPPPGSNAQSAFRHNMFLAEMMLRLAETGDHVHGIWGDLFSSEHMFHTPRDNMERRKSHGDSIVVTDNGSLIIFELSTATISGRDSYVDIMNKAASWVGVIANSKLDISVIFIDTRWGTNRRSLFRAVYNGVMEGSAAYCPDEYSRQQVLHHVGIVDAAWWFPDDNAVSQAATRITAFSPSLHTYRAFDQPDPNRSTPELRRNVMVNTTAALHSPLWIFDPIVERNYRIYERGLNDPRGSQGGKY